MGHVLHNSRQDSGPRHCGFFRSWQEIAAWWMKWSARNGAGRGNDVCVYNIYLEYIVWYVITVIYCVHIYINIIIYIYTLYLNCIYHMRVSILRVTCVSLDMGYLPASIQPAQRLRGNTYLQPLVYTDHRRQRVWDRKRDLFLCWYSTNWVPSWILLGLCCKHVLGLPISRLMRKVDIEEKVATAGVDFNPWHPML